MTRKFLRQDSVRHVRLGKNRKKLQKWRRPRGMHSKIRKKRFGYPVFPMTGFKKPSAISGKVRGKVPFLISCKGDLEKVGKDMIVVFSRKIGAKKRIELMKIAQEKKFDILTRNRRKE